MNKVWLDMSPYGLHLFLARGTNPSDHFIALTGAGIEDNKKLLVELGFVHDARPQFNKPGGNRYWICPASSITLGSIRGAFPYSEVKEMPVESIFPAAQPKRVSTKNATNVDESLPATPSASGLSSRDSAVPVASNATSGGKLSAKSLSESSARLKILEDLISKDVEAGAGFDGFIEKYFDQSGSMRRLTPYFSNGRVDLSLAFDDLLSFGYQIDGQPEFELFWNKIKAKTQESLIVEPLNPESAKSSNADTFPPATDNEALNEVQPVKWFGSKEKADSFIDKKKLAKTHEVVFDGRSRWEIRLLSTTVEDVTAAVAVISFDLHIERLVAETLGSGQNSARELFSSIVKKHNLTPSDQIEIKHRFQSALKEKLTSRESSILDPATNVERKPWEIPLQEFTKNPESNPYFTTSYTENEQSQYLNDVHAYHQNAVIKALVEGMAVPDQVTQDYAQEVVPVTTIESLSNVIAAGVRAHIDGLGGNGRTIWIEESSDAWEAREMEDDSPGVVIGVSHSAKNHAGGKSEFVAQLVLERKYFRPPSNDLDPSVPTAEVLADDLGDKDVYAFPEIQSWPDDRVDHFKGVLSENPPPAEIPNGWIVMNCTRPLLGQVFIENGPYLSGRYYVGIDPNDSASAAYIQKNYDLDASVVLVASIETQIQLALIGNEYKSRYLALEPDERIHALGPLISSFKGKPVGKIKSLVQSALVEHKSSVTEAPDSASHAVMAGDDGAKPALSVVDQITSVQPLTQSNLAGDPSNDINNSRASTVVNRGRSDVNGTPTDGLLGLDLPPIDAGPLSRSPGGVEPDGSAAKLSPKPTAVAEGGGSSVGERLEAKQPVTGGSGDSVSGQNSLGERIEAVRSRGAARRAEQELSATSGGDQKLEGLPSGVRTWTGLTVADLAYTTGENLNTAAHVQTAIKTLLRHEAGDKLSNSERSTLAAFRGWGGVAGALRTDNKRDYENRLGKETAALLGLQPESFNQLVLNNRLESYYTPGSYGSAIWQAIQHLGVRSDARVLDAGCGGAIFFASAPAEYQRDATLVGVECDPIAARFARAIAPEAKIIEKKFENVVLSKDGFDCVLGNVPFGETKIFDKEMGDSLHIHDYFILKSLKHLKQGGIMSVITSSGTMDKQDPAIRRMIMDQANLVAAYRLPVQSFEDQKATVTTDILILQKRPKGTLADYDFSTTEEVEIFTADRSQSKNVSLNRYFVDNPENVLGKNQLVGSAFGPKYSVQLNLAALMQEQGRDYNPYNENNQAVKHAAIATAIGSRISMLPKDLVLRTEWPRDEGFSFMSTEPGALDESAFLMPHYDGLIGDYTFNEGKLIEIIDILPVFDDDGILISQSYVAQPLSYMKPGEQSLISDYIPLRQATRRLVQAQLAGNDDSLLLEQNAVTQQYNQFVTKYGPINSAKVSRVIEDDSGSAEVAALEVWDEKESVVVQLADIFTKRVVNPEKEHTIVESTSDALALSIDRKGRIDFGYMQGISNFTYDELVSGLVGNDIFKNPETEEFELRNQYLSGNVIKKLRIAEQITAIDPEYAVNVSSLKDVLPDKIPFEEITIRLGAGWIPADDVRQFTTNLFKCPELCEVDFRVRHIPNASLWSVEVSNGFKRNNEQARTTLYGHKSASYESLLEKLLNGSRPTHRHEVDGRMVVDEEATLLSSEMQKKINDEFNTWVASDKQRIIQYTDLYNEANNIFVVPKADGSRLTFPGLSPSWAPRAHQSGAVAMSMMGYNFLAAHPVGSGKTFEEIAIAVKLKQLGIVTKPAVAVPNHMLGQIAREAKQMFPAAKILMITQEDLRGKSRKRFLSVARNNDWDLIVMTHSMLNQISAPRQIVEGYYTAQIAEIETVISNCDSVRLERQLIAKRKTVENKLDNLRQDLDAEERVGARVYIDELGIDLLNVDEWHLYKNLELNSSMNVLGVTNSGSQRATNLHQISLYLQQHWKKPFGLNGFTGTVISNTMCELFVHNKMLRPDLLEEMEIFSFDDWASRFGEVVTSLEALPEGGGYKVSERFAKFINLPEMLSLFRSFADVRSKEELNLPTPEVTTEVVSVPPTLWQQAYMKHLANRAIAVRNMQVSLSVDNLLNISTDGRKASLDMRLCEADLPDDCSLKLATAATNIHAVWERFTEQKATQLVFLDLGTPGKGKEFVAYDAIADDLIAKGIPRGEVEFIHNFKTPEAKEDVFERVRSGKVRVLLGSTEKMGVGTNVQDRLVAIHHIDTGWNPAAIEQRRGRGERQGNKFFDQIFEFRYTTIDSFDLFMWETNKRKANFINQALADPKHAGREVSEEMDLGYAEVLAVTTGNPLIREKVMTDDKVTKLQRQQRSWASEKSRIDEALNNCERRLSWEKRELNELTIASGYLPSTTFKPVEIQGSISGLQDGDTSWLYAKEVGTALSVRLPFLEARLMRSMDKAVPLKVSIGAIELHLSMERLGAGIHFAIQPMVDGELLAIAQRKVRLGISKDPVSMGRAVRELYELRGYLVESTERNVKKCEAEVERLLGGSVRTDRWIGEPELVQALARQSELNRHFATQVASLASTDDPYLEMLEEYRSQMATQLEESAFLAIGHHGAPDHQQGLLLESTPSGSNKLPNKYSETEFALSESRYERMTLR